MLDRLRGLLRDRGFSPNEVEAVLAQNPDRVDDVVQRLEAVQAFAALPESARWPRPTSASRTSSRRTRKRSGRRVDAALLQDEAEKKLPPASSACSRKSTRPSSAATSPAPSRPWPSCATTSTPSSTT
jgi:glycyl-tRNA synthetase beta chain